MNLTVCTSALHLHEVIGRLDNYRTWSVSFIGTSCFIPQSVRRFDFVSGWEWHDNKKTRKLESMADDNGCIVTGRVRRGLSLTPRQGALVRMSITACQDECCSTSLIKYTTQTVHLNHRNQENVARVFFFIFLWCWSYVLIIVKNVNQMFVVRYIYVMRSLTIVIIQCISGTIKESSSWILNLLVGYKCTDYNIVFLLYELTGWFWI